MTTPVNRLSVSFTSISSHSIIVLSTGLTITLLSAIVAGVASRLAQPELPFWFLAVQPSATLASREWIFLIPILNLLLEMLLIFCLIWLAKLDDTILRLFAWTVVFSQGLLLLALVRILYITA